ncbi:MAG TPA: PP2C family protein-serine/threonine phosphatase, partial [Solirubrobacteraceae bacterium]
LAVGGHPPPLCIGEGGVSEIGEHGTLLGALGRTRWPETRVELRPGETLVAFTDGVTDTVGEGGVRWGTDRLRAALSDARGRAPSEIGARLVTALDEFQVGPQADDTAVVIMRYSGESPTGGRLDQLSSVGARGNG